MGRERDELFRSPPFAIEPAWVDANGHLNMAYYHVLFDRAVDGALSELDFGDAYRERENASVFVVETHICYRREVRAEDRVCVRTQLLGRDAKRLHTFQTMFRVGDDDGAVATLESLFVHVSLRTRRAVPIAPRVADGLDAAIERHRAAGTPAAAGRRIAALTARAS